MHERREAAPMSGADLPARSPPPPDRARLRDDAQRPARARLRDRRLAAVPPGRRDPLDRLGRVRAALVGEGARRVHRPRALRGRGAERRRRLRPQPGLRVLLAAAAVARQARSRCGAALDLVLPSAAQAGGFVGYVDFADGEPFWLPPRGERRVARRAGRAARPRPVDRAGATASSAASSISSSTGGSSRPAASCSCSRTSSCRRRGSPG